MAPARKRPRILFVALAQSSHTHAWISLIESTDFDVKVFGVQGTRLPDGLPISMVTSPSRIHRLGHQILQRVVQRELVTPDARVLADFVHKWQPDIIHTLGLEPASYLFLDVKRRLGRQLSATWVVTARGGPELTLSRLLPREAARIAAVLRDCDQFIADNELNYRYAIELGLVANKAAPFGRVPGVGGVDIEALQAQRTVPAGQSRIVVMPKAYECPASKVLPVFEALTLCWDRIQPCEVYFTAATPEAEMWFATLPEAIRIRCHIRARIPREELLELMGRARVLLAPSLTDGVPNVLYEAMASGCLPIVSPIETLRPLLVEGRNAVFARNLYPDEIARALERAMSDDALVETVVAHNHALIGELADRAKIRRAVGENYHDLAARRQTRRRA